MSDVIDISAANGRPYYVAKSGRKVCISRQTPDGQFVHRIICSSRDAYKIADALIDTAEQIDSSFSGHYCATDPGAHIIDDRFASS